MRDWLAAIQTKGHSVDAFIPRPERRYTLAEVDEILREAANRLRRER